MKRFIIKSLVFFFIVFGLAWALDYSISKGLLQMENYRFKPWHDMIQGDINADVIIMGNSRGLSHFEPWTIDSICGTTSYCLGMGGYGITVETLKYYCYRLYNKKPKCIVQQVDYYTMRYYTAPHQHESEQFLPLIYDKRMHQELLRVGYKPIDLYCPLYRYFGYQTVIKNGLLEYLGLKHYVIKPSRKGHYYEDLAWDGDNLAKMDTVDATMDSRAQRHFENYLNMCQEEGVKVVLVNSPTYVGANLKTKGLEKVNAYFDSIAKQYNTVYLNYNENFDLCYDTANFCVSIHMNPHAVHVFTIDFAHELNSLGIIN